MYKLNLKTMYAHIVTFEIINGRIFATVERNVEPENIPDTIAGAINFFGESKFSVLFESDKNSFFVELYRIFAECLEYTGIQGYIYLLRN